METKYVKVPFEVELAKKITNGEVEGRIVTRDERSSRVVCWDRKNSKLSIVALTSDKNGMENIMSFTKDGAYWDNGGSDDRDLMVEIPEYMTFKDGDIATLGWKSDDGEFCEWITILKSVEADEINILTEDYVTFCLECDEENYFPIDFDCTSDGAKWIRKPTEPEKQKLIEALKASKDERAKECLKMLGIEVKPECKFKPFDRVLVRNFDYNKWSADIFSQIDGDMHECVGGIWTFCIPYNEQTAHLLGTTDNWEENK